MRLQIKTLSPVHIGNGEKYNGLAYIANRENVLLYDSNKIMENLTTQQKQRFMLWLEQNIGEIERLETQKRKERDEEEKRKINQTLRDAQKKLSLKEFIENSIRDTTTKNKFNNNFLYSVKAETKIFSNVDIDCFTKQNNKSYIPGTEIKGGIRTAVAYHLLQDEGHWRYFKKELENFGNNYRKELQQISGQKGRWVNDVKKKLTNEMGKIEDTLQNKLFRVIDKNDAKYDLLKLLHIGDTELIASINCLFVSNFEVTGISRGFPLFQELCKKDTVFTCQGFKLENNKTILDKLGFTHEQKWVVSDIKNLLQCCYEFTDRLLYEEIGYFSKLNKPKIVSILQYIMQQNIPTSPIIRIGKNEGYLSLTIGLLVKDKDKDLYNNVFCHATKNTSYSGNFLKTRRIVNLSNNEQDTLGWVKLIIEN
ncbi:MAG: hypothetical protein HBSIN01_17450 [Candidatus Brocadia sinica]|uniref:type III-A CRISPR-associated RAMP protein Csm5 n=1 Tax=Candidatus Brocadia sp. AMX2 TaxID=2293635 RepID=UPI0017C86B32|nr:type III-A CRISPR-associated RAMP protein Csm5 [Candidatus Brocadia sp. AMX2]NOG39967.1 type III-A CRISPR-associated RAMP protein Csm5 [Planctomycetota bacterium]NUQ57672.1 type III-A CRISPR-associated RAMP protein Csm5 [Candidatus Paceibacter sp.]GIK12855.1 MAG: hypothetical protein BroJett002_15620 [Candidatus Brocadia sinica]GJQ17786.1 MAG: hypothetical protein HBSIN01_17450 [Candidatus Brocadia sinica]